MKWCCCACEVETRSRVRPALCHHCGAVDSYLPAAPINEAGAFKRADRLSSKPAPRLSTGEANLDALLGGGFPAGSTILLWGRGGSGKSRCALRWSTRSGVTACVSLEMTDELCSSTAHSAGGRNDRLLITRDEKAELPRSARFCVYDSISRAREPAQALERLEQWAKRTGGVAIVVCHATKAGDYRGPSTLQHWGDAEMQVSASKRQPGSARVRVNKSRFCGLGSAVVPIVGATLHLVG